MKIMLIPLTTILFLVKSDLRHTRPVPATRTIEVDQDIVAQNHTANQSTTDNSIKKGGYLVAAALIRNFDLPDRFDL